ncbi:hypothetical protein [Dactylosporangium sp. NPDC048998]|uniref:hypothetical protein n=1 Tax=Dactylosporangium sp. NPDC048998 TaxID=3363976 RepID=UPI0037113D5F
MYELFDSGALLRFRIEHLFNQARHIARNNGLESGPADGVTPGNVHQVVLPLGPHLIASLRPRDAFDTIAVPVIETLN